MRYPKENEALKLVLKMAQESLSPDVYEGFVKAYDQMILNRGLDILPSIMIKRGE